MDGGIGKLPWLTSLLQHNQLLFSFQEPFAGVSLSQLLAE